MGCNCKSYLIIAYVLDIYSVCVVVFLCFILYCCYVELQVASIMS